MHTRIWIILLAYLCASIEGLEQDTLVDNLPGYAVTTAIDQLNSTRCRKEMEEYRDAVDRRLLWGLKTLDSSGQPTSGFISGNNFWMGNRDQCEFLSQKRSFAVKEEKAKNIPLYRNLESDFPPFPVNFFGAQMRHNSAMQYHLSVPLEEVLVLGICLPASCTEHEVTTMLRKVFDEKLLLATRLYSIDVEFLKISNLNDDYTWLLSGKMIVIFLILAVLFGLVIAGTIYDVRVHQKPLKEKLKSHRTANNIVEANGDMDEKREQLEKYTTGLEMKTDNRAREILLCFSAYSNVKRMFDLNTGSEDISSFHGLRFFTMLWVIIFHIIYYTMNVMANRAEGYVIGSDVVGQIVINASIAVDTFFVLSGFLLTHAHLKKQTKSNEAISFYNSVINLIDAVVNRYIRIMPAYFVTMLLVTVIFTWLEQFSLMYFSEPMHNVCSKYWWRNVLFISNLYDWDELCLNWTWYLSNDMQFYIFGTIILMLSTSYYYTAIAIGVLVIIASTVVHAYVAYSTGYIPTLDMYYETVSYLYIKPHMRIPPFIVGMGTALLLSKWNYKLELSKKALATCWSVAILLLLTMLFGLANREMSLWLAVLYESCSRFVWSLGIAWIIIACITGNGGILNTVLSFSWWIPLGRLTYCAYLLNPVVIISIAMLSKHPLQVDVVIVAVISIGSFVIVYMVSIVLMAVAEMPIRLCFQKFHISSRKLQPTATSLATRS